MSGNKQSTLEDVMNQMIQFNERLHTKIKHIENNILNLSKKIENKLEKIENQLIDIECENKILKAKVKETEDNKIKEADILWNERTRRRKNHFKKNN
ncbi:hypothetical protein JTB14_000633 [Gonioctena quinquepunctata]|nr:hypothetical protein JTB14_000633 [Gonioctena quinquepunctata]